MSSRAVAFSKRFAYPLWPWYLAGTCALALTNIITLEIPLFAKDIINSIADLAERDRLTRLALIIIGLGCLQMIIRTLSRVLLFWPGRALESNAKQYYFDRLLKLPQSFYVKFGMGDLISRLANDIGQLRVFYAFGILQILNLLFLSLFTLSRMLTIHAGLTFACLLPLCLMLVIMRYGLPLMHKFSRDNQDALGRLTNRVTEAFVNVHVVQVNAAENTFVERARDDNVAVYTTNIKLLFIRTILFPLMSCLVGLSQVIVLFYGANEVLAGRLTVGDIMAFNVFIAFLAFPLSAIGMIVAIYQRCLTALDRLYDIEDGQEETPAVSSVSLTTPTTKPLLEIQHLSYAFSDNSSFALQDISLRLEPGKKIGLIGAIGSGKTTLLNLITRLWDPPATTIFFNGSDILSINPRELRKLIGYGQQSVHLFSDTIAHNLQFGVDQPVTQAQLEEVAGQAHILDEIMGFENQWQTEIGERGIRLSGGQKQRLAIARLLLRQPKLLLLDDVLSAVDQKTEHHLVQVINQIKCTAIIASHRLSAVRDCDEIILLDKGRILDRGDLTDIRRRHPRIDADQVVTDAT